MASVVSHKSTRICIISLCVILLFSLADFKVFSLSLVFNSLIMIGLMVQFHSCFRFPELPGSIEIFIIKLGTLVPFLWIIFLLFSLLFHWHSNYLYFRLLETALQVTKCLLDFLKSFLSLFFRFDHFYWSTFRFTNPLFCILHQVVKFSLYIL